MCDLLVRAEHWPRPPIQSRAAGADVTYAMTSFAGDDDFDPAIHEWEPAIAAALAGDGVGR
jgi:hypothetical protein